jgi:uncharacterized protein (TIGR00369 family)
MPAASSTARPGAHHPDSSSCYGCAPQLGQGLRVRILGSRSVEFVVAAVHEGTPGRAHGGVLAALIDEAIGIAVWSLGRPYATARLEIDYLRPVPIGSTVQVDTRFTGAHGRKVYAEAEARIRGDEDAVAVRAAALYVEVPAELPRHCRRS